MDNQNLCLRAGRPFYLEAKQDFRLCRQQLAQCPRDLQVDIYVHKGDWVIVTRRFPGLVYVYYDYTPLARYSHDFEQGYADVNLLQAPQARQ